ncbi:MAG: type II toxin-antitoxin system YafQ family toxin [Leptospiraceae bacterium]|nr:type II toxin-antitoxin system YafQ family toxin [Leptospiraceae bacterium]MCP5496379.1 type II toxin-antitoxin system YafQ family toxin [Leptospiraceae bacterium]
MISLSTHKNFVKDLQKAKLTQTNVEKLFLYISILLNKGKLPKEAKDHQLIGEWDDTKEFHISGDLVVIYQLENDVLKLLRIGTHSQLFRKF